MASPPRKKSELAKELMQANRDMGTAALMFHQAVADRLGLNTTDHKCLDLLHKRADTTAGDLAEWTGLTTGAVTGIIDRLEQAGFVRREQHPTDRRKVVIRPVRERLAEVGALFESLAREMTKLCERHSVEEIDVIRGYMKSTADVFRSETRRLRGKSEG